jgi:hypothetical protein
MPDTRSRHAPCEDVWHRPNAECPDTMCSGCEAIWPCDAIREADEAASWRVAATTWEAAYNVAADRADKSLARCQELAERLDECGAEVVEQSDRADKAEAALALMRIGADELMASVAWERGRLADMMAQRDAARADAKALAERVEALEQPCACFRVDHRPSEALHRLLDKTAGALAAHKAQDPS